MYQLNANGVITFRYVINASGTPLALDFVNIGITKI